MPDDKDDKEKLPDHAYSFEELEGNIRNTPNHLLYTVIKKHPLVVIPSVVELGSLSDIQDGTIVKRTRYNATLEREYVPVGVGVNTQTATDHIQATASATSVDLQPNAGEEYDIYYLSVVSNALGANRNIDIGIYDGTGMIHHLHASSWATATSNMVFPIDLTTDHMPATQNFPSPFPIDNSNYLRLSTAGLTGAETITCHYHAKIKYLDGLRR